MVEQSLVQNKKTRTPVDASKQGLWFLNANGQEHEFKADGIVRRLLDGDGNQVKFDGLCILNDMPDLDIKMDGVATLEMITYGGQQQQESEEAMMAAADGESEIREVTAVPIDADGSLSWETLMGDQIDESEGGIVRQQQDDDGNGGDEGEFEDEFSQDDPYMVTPIRPIPFSPRVIVNRQPSNDDESSEDDSEICSPIRRLPLTPTGTIKRKRSTNVSKQQKKPTGRCGLCRMCRDTANADRTLLPFCIRLVGPAVRRPLRKTRQSQPPPENIEVEEDIEVENIEVEEEPQEQSPEAARAIEDEDETDDDFTDYDEPNEPGPSRGVKKVAPRVTKAAPRVAKAAPRVAKAGSRVTKAAPPVSGIDWLRGAALDSDQDEDSVEDPDYRPETSTEYEASSTDASESESDADAAFPEELIGQQLADECNLEVLQDAAEDVSAILGSLVKRILLEAVESDDQGQIEADDVHRAMTRIEEETDGALGLFKNILPG